MATNGRKSICYLSRGLYVWKNDTAMSESSIPAGLCKLNHGWNLSSVFLVSKEVHEAFYGKYNGIFCAYANSVYQASLWGGEGGAWERG